ncbi:prepilin peptidase [Candidatus Micrarchaeota archaeon]|nr:prepilin peptidase [Candidatus Micrarchaeota archaeon]
MFSNIPLIGELYRLIVAFIGLAIVSYYDIFNRRNVPDMLVYGFLGIAIIMNIIFFDWDLAIYSFGFSFFVFAIGYAFYRLGQIGGADIYALTSLSLLIPFVPNGLFNYPFVFSVLLVGGALFALFAVFFFLKDVLESKKKPNLFYLALLIPYVIFVYFFFNAPFFSFLYFAIASTMLLATVFFLVFREAIEHASIKSVRLSELDNEDVLAGPDTEKIMKKYKIGRVLGEKEAMILKKAGVKKVPIYKNLPPFAPFLLIGMVVAYLLGGFLF